MFILQKPMSSYVHSAKTYGCLCPFCKNLCLAMFILQKPMSSYMHSTKTYGCCGKLALNPDPGRETQICCCAVVQVVVYMLYMLVGRSSRLFTIPQAILMYVYVWLQWESPSSSPLVVLERLVIRSSCIGSLGSSCTGETNWRGWLHIATKKM